MKGFGRCGGSNPATEPKTAQSAETHLQNSEKFQSPKIAPPFRHHRPYIRLRRNFPRPSPCKRACRPPGGETEPTPLRGASRLGRMGDYSGQQKRHADGVPFLLAGMAGFEPTTARVKVWCLTAWRHPKNIPVYCTIVFPICQYVFGVEIQDFLGQ